jgi:argininosuccinate lyase
MRKFGEESGVLLGFSTAGDDSLFARSSRGFRISTLSTV